MLHGLERSRQLQLPLEGCDPLEQVVPLFRPGVGCLGFAACWRGGGRGGNLGSGSPLRFVLTRRLGVEPLPDDEAKDHACAGGEAVA